MCTRLLGESPSSASPLALCGHDHGSLCVYDLRATAAEPLIDAQLHEKPREYPTFFRAQACPSEHDRKMKLVWSGRECSHITETKRVLLYWPVFLEVPQYQRGWNSYVPAIGRSVSRWYLVHASGRDSFELASTSFPLPRTTGVCVFCSAATLPFHSPALLHTRNLYRLDHFFSISTVLCVDVGFSGKRGVSGSADNNIHVFKLNAQKVGAE